MTERVARLLAAACALMCVAAAAASLWPLVNDSRSEDRNGDGRPDVWRTYDHQRRLSEVSIDTNFDGRSDVQEYHDRGSLVRRESDRDFSDRVDLIEEFDATTHEPVRSVTDVDYDGTADLLELFQAGQLVYVKWQDPAPSTAPSSRAANGQLAPLQDPFRADLAVSAALLPVGSGEWMGLSTSGGLPEPSRDGIGPLAFSVIVPLSKFALPASASVGLYSPRGPPFARLLA